MGIQTEAPGRQEKMVIEQKKQQKQSIKNCEFENLHLDLAYEERWP